MAFKTNAFGLFPVPRLAQYERMNEPNDPTTQSSSSSSRVWKILGCGCLALIVLGLLGGAGIFVAFGKLMKGNAPYQDSIATVQSNPAAIEALGEPIKPGFFMSGSINLNNGDGTVDFTIPVSGPKGKGTVRVKGTKSSAAPAWQYELWQLEIPGQDPIPLEKP